MEFLRQLLVPADPQQQGRLKVWAVGAASYALCGSVQVIEVALGLLERRLSDPLLVAMACAALVFFGLIRSGLNQRIASDPTLTLVQLAFGLGFSIWSYTITGAARGAILMVLISNLVFGAVSLAPRQLRRLALAALAVLGAAMLACALHDPLHHPWRLELVHFLFTGIVMGTVTWLSGHLSELRSRLGRQTKDLKAALAQLQQVATRDELTQIHNRRHLGELMAAELRRHERSDAPLCLALLDIDWFKSINDRFGHAVGDKVLQRFAAAAQGVLRATDLLGRWGGEEFLVLLPDTPIEQAPAALERLRQRLAHEDFGAMAPGLQVTFSCGLTLCAPGESIEAATERADQAMYAAKTQGRNRTTVLLPGDAADSRPAMQAPAAPAEAAAAPPAARLRPLEASA
ncbi:GGDEF domain-containing protein [Aquabacterium sp.]|uniref:GGDEF domain-containing protein n=1 Tax=Aquabacterium sp. TaxID=1872578 RepID=UPI00378333E6